MSSARPPMPPIPATAPENSKDFGGSEGEALLPGRSLIFPRLRNRLTALPVFLAGATVLGLAAWLRPDPAGLGTHRQLGLPPCAFEQMTGVPCATCGCTTSFSHAANGSMLDAFTTQPFGALLAVLTAMAVLTCGYAVVAGMPVTPLARSIGRGRVLVALLVFMMLAWGYTIFRHLG